jgi:hypothetical protein
MITVTIGTNLDRKEILVDPETKTLKDLFKENGVAYERATNYLDGCPINAAQINQTLAQLNVTSDCSILSVIKNDNA